MNSNKLNRIFVKNYLYMLAILMTITVVTVLTIGLMPFISREEDFDASDLLEEDYNDIMIPRIKDKVSYVIMDESYQVKKQVGEKIADQSKYTQEEFIFLVNKMQTEEQKFSLAHQQDSGYWLLLVIEPSLRMQASVQFNFEEERTPDLFGMLIIIATYLLLLGLGVYIFSKITSKEVVAIVSKENEKKQDALKHLILDVSHDLKNPIMAMQGYAKLAMDETDIDKRNEYLEIISKQSNRANYLSIHLFELAKWELNDYQPIKKKMDLCELIRLCILERESEFKVNELEIVFTTEKEEVEIEGNEQELLRVIHNLLDNAILYHAKPSQLRICIDCEAGFVKTSFANRTNLKNEELLKVMKPFARTEESIRYHVQGAGIGLQVVHKIVEYHNGKVECVINEQNEFVILLFFPI